MPKKMLDLYDTFPVSFKMEPSNKEAIMKDSKGEEVKGGYSLICEVDATHSGTLINNRIYPPESMKRGIRSWTTPYKKPVLTNHDDTKDPIGRVVSGKYLQTEKGIADKDWKPILRESEGYGYQRLTLKITDGEAIKKILDGRYQTVSVRMSTDHCTCSICGCDWSGGDGPCEHTPGSKYEGKLAYMTTGDLSYRELSFVNIPADEYAGVREAIIADNKNSAEISLYANSDSDKILSDLSSGVNLYSLLDAEAEESDDIVKYLLDKSSKAMIINEEEDVKLTDYTKDQLKDLDVVKALVQENIDSLTATQKAALKELEDKVTTLTVELEDAKKKKEDEEEEKKKKLSGGKEKDPEAEDGEGKDCSCGMDGGKHAKSCPMYKDEENEEEEEEVIGEDGKKVKKPKKGAPVPKELPENKGKGKSGGVKHGEGNLAPVQEDPHESDSAEVANKVKELEDSNRKVLDENVKINSELHKMVAERLFDLKKSLRKPDVIAAASAEARDKKVEEFAQRSVDSIKDQIKDLLIEQDNALATGLYGELAVSPALSPVDMTNEVMVDKKKTREGKQDTLTRLFPKSA